MFRLKLLPSVEGQDFEMMTHNLTFNLSVVNLVRFCYCMIVLIDFSVEFIDP